MTLPTICWLGPGSCLRQPTFLTIAPETPARLLACCRVPRLGTSPSSRAFSNRHKLKISKMDQRDEELLDKQLWGAVQLPHGRTA
jgi:hypothetical protein